jgi:hypothetical protein
MRLSFIHLSFTAQDFSLLPAFLFIFTPPPLRSLSYVNVKRDLHALFRDFTQRRLVVCCRRFGTTYRSRLQESSFILEDGTDRLSRNVGNKLPIYAVQSPRRAQVSCTLRRKPEIKVKRLVLVKIIVWTK